jgi:hypothetical protein
MNPQHLGVSGLVYALLPQGLVDQAGGLGLCPPAEDVDGGQIHGAAAGVDLGGDGHHPGRHRDTLGSGRRGRFRGGHHGPLFTGHVHQLGGILPVCLELGFDPLWFSVLICIVLQTSFLTPPFGYAIFYFAGAAPAGNCQMMDIHKGMQPLIALQAVGVLICGLVPSIIACIPSVVFR